MRSNPQETAALVAFTEEILNGKLHFLCSDKSDNSFPLISDMLGVTYRYFRKGKNLMQHLAFQLRVTFICFVRADGTRFQNNKYNALKTMLHNYLRLLLFEQNATRTRPRNR